MESPSFSVGTYCQSILLNFLPVQIIDQLLSEQAKLLAYIQPISYGVLLALSIVLLLLCISAMVSASEIAFFSLTNEKLALLNEDKKHYPLILNLLKNPRRLLATILITNTFVNLGIVITGSYITLSLFDFAQHPVISFIIEVILITFLILLLGETMPKVYANQNVIKIAKIMVVPLSYLDKLFMPFSNVLVYSTNFIDKRIKKKKHEVSVEDLSHVINIATGETTSNSEKDMLKGIVNMGTIPVKQIMRSRIDITAVNYNTKYDNLLKIVKESGYSRIPVFEENFDKIKGILYVKDLLMHLEGNDDFKWQQILRAPYFVPENKKIDDLLKDFQEKKIHMAIVVDEYGGCSGIITLEDVLEEIVGEITDEFDEDAPVFSKIDDHTFIFEGKTSLNDISKIMGLELNVFDSFKGDSDSLGGLVLEISGKMPKVQEEIHHKNFVFKIESADRRKINKVKIVINKNEN